MAKPMMSRWKLTMYLWAAPGSCCRASGSPAAAAVTAPPKAAPKPAAAGDGNVVSLAGTVVRYTLNGPTGRSWPTFSHPRSDEDERRYHCADGRFHQNHSRQRWIVVGRRNHDRNRLSLTTQRVNEKVVSMLEALELLCLHRFRSHHLANGGDVVIIAGLLWLAVYKQFEPLLLVPIAFGALLANLPRRNHYWLPAGK